MSRKTFLILGLAAILMVAASAPWTWNASPPPETIITWTAGDTSLGSMVIDSSDGSATTACTSMVYTQQFNADSNYFVVYSNGASTTGNDDTVWILAAGYTKNGTLIDTSLIAIDTLDNAANNLFKVWNTKVDDWPYMRIVKKCKEDTAGTGYVVDTTYGCFYRKGDNP